jgi:ribonucleoside-diphosphate reductase alpha chain
MINIPEETLRWFQGDELRARVFYEKYALRDFDGNIIEKTPPEMWRRVAREIASQEKTPELQKEWEKRFYSILEDFKFVPGGRILFGAGNPRKATLLNCYYIPIKEDSIEGIFDCAKEMARTYSYGGGVGIDITILRPKGSPVSNSAIFSTGAVSFMDLFSKVTGTIGQAGRRGALMITLEVRHPDVFDFIDVKDDPLRLSVRYANISLKITDDFMKAVKEDGLFTLWFENERVKRIEHKVRARDIRERTFFF